MARGGSSSGASLWEERPPFYRRKRRRREAVSGAEGNAGDETNRQQPKRRAVQIQCPLQKKCFSFRVTFRIPVVCGKYLDIGSAHSRNPRCDEAWRGGRRRRSSRGCPSCSHAHTSGERTSLIRRSNSHSTSNVGLNISSIPCLAQMG